MKQNKLSLQKLSSKEKMIKSLRLEPVDEIPIFEGFISTKAAKRFVPNLVTPDYKKIIQADWSAKRKNEILLDLLRSGLKKQLEVIEAAGLDGISISIHPEVEWITPDELRTEFGRIYKPNLNLLGYGQVSQLEQGESGEWIGSEVEKIEDLLTLKLDPANNKRLQMLEGFSDAKVLVIPELLVLERVWEIFGYLKWMELITKNKPLFKKILKKWEEYNFRALDILLDYGFRVFWYGDDFGSSQGGLYPQKEFKEIIHPYLKRLVDACHEKGALIILHSCGDIREYLDDIVEIGFDGLHPLEPPMMNFAFVKEKVGKNICLIGNVDSRTTLVNGSKKDVIKETKQKIQLGNLQGHILCSSHSIHDGVSFENWVTMLECARKFGNREWLKKHPLKGKLSDYYKNKPSRKYLSCSACEMSKPRSEIPNSWGKVIKLRKEGKLGAADVYLASREHQKPETKLRSKILIGTVATPHETGREIVASCLRASGYKAKDVGVITPKNYLSKLDDAEIIFLSCVKNPQAIDQGRVIVRKLRKHNPNVKIVIGGGAINKLMMDKIDEGKSMKQAKKWMKDFMGVDVVCKDEVEAIEAANQLVQDRK